MNLFDLYSKNDLKFNFFVDGDKPLPGEIFVFGSNLAGRHGAGAAKDAVDFYGAIYGVGQGLQGNSYGVATKDENVETLPLMMVQKNIEDFVNFTINNPHLRFFITKVGCGLAGYKNVDIAPMFKGIGSNCRVHQDWWYILKWL